MMKTPSGLQELPLDIVGSTAFGRYPKISIEQTFNMLISDDWLVNYAGYEVVAHVEPKGQGRGIYASTIYNKIVFVIDGNVYTYEPGATSAQKIATIPTQSGDVFIDGNNAGQIAICDQLNMYILNLNNGTFATAGLNFTPNYVTFQDTYFIAGRADTNVWRLSNNNDGLNWPDASPNVGTIQTKPDNVVGMCRVPGKGNLLFVFGSTVTELWFDTGYQLFPYQKNSYTNIDFGCVNAATIASNDNIVVWVGQNEKSGPVVMVSDGGEPKQVSNDGINFRLAQLTDPGNCYGFLFKQDGHQIYQVTWPNDNLSLAFDFTTNKIFTLTNEFQQVHIAKRVAFLNDTYYFVSLVDGNLYELNSNITTYNGAEIPRIRICKSIRLPKQNWFVCNNLTFTIEQGYDSSLSRVDLSLSKDGGQHFGNVFTKTLNPLPQRQSRLNYWNLGAANDLTPQFRFWGKSRFVANNGIVSIYQ